MAKKIQLFSELILGMASVVTLSFAAAISPAHACVDADGNPIVGKNGETANCAYADEEGTEPPILIAPAPTADGDLYSEAGDKVDSSHDVSHSFFTAGNNVTSKDTVRGIHFLAGNLVEYTGSAEYGAFAGNSLKINGEIKNDLFAAGNAIEIGEDALIGRDLYAAATTVLVKTNLNGNAFITGSRVVLENVTIMGDLNLEASEVVIKGKSSISGKFSYNDNAQITGLENLTTGETATYAGHTNEVTFGQTITSKLIFLLGRLLVTIVFIVIAKKFSKRLLDEFEGRSAWKDLALGLGLLIGVPLAGIFVMITMIGLPLGVIGLVFYGLLVYFATSATGGVVGHLLANRRQRIRS